MAVFAAGLLIYCAILMHGCDVRRAGEAQADAMREAAKACHPIPEPQHGVSK